MINDPNYWLGMVLHKVADTHEYFVRLELRQSDCRFLTIGKIAISGGERGLVGWVALYARHIGHLRRGLRQAHTQAANYELGDSYAIEFVCELDGKSWADSTKKVRIILSESNGAKVLTLRPYFKVGEKWHLDDEYQVLLGLDDLNDIVEALASGAPRTVDATTGNN